VRDIKMSPSIDMIELTYERPGYLDIQEIYILVLSLSMLILALHTVLKCQ